MKRLAMDINVGIGDHLILRIFMDGVKHQYDQIAITHSRPGMAFWHNNDQKRWDFNLQLGKLLFSEPPYVLVPNANFPFYPVHRIIQELNNKPVKPNLDCLCVGKSLEISPYVVLTTKQRQIPREMFEQMKEKLTPALQTVASKYMVVISGEREVQRTREYEANVNKDLVYGLYDYYMEILPKDKVLDLSIPALGVTCSEMPQLQQDCLIMKEARAVITFGVGGNLWIAACVANNTIGFRGDPDPIIDMIHTGFPGLFLSRDINQFIAQLHDL
jgi:hypothetical protein